MSEKREVMLDLDISEEYGGFEDIKLVNPFDEIFRNAVEQKELKKGLNEPDEESLHTPQVFPQLEGASKSAPTPARQQSTPLITDLVLPETNTANNVATAKSTEPVKKYRAIAAKPSPSTAKPILLLTQSQVLTVNVLEPISTSTNGKGITTGTAIPVQTVKPLILPKVETKLKPNNQASGGSGICTVTSPSSASLPTSQLPIKERLKVILNNNKTQYALVTTEAPLKVTNNLRRTHESNGKYNERCMERRRAAATRYRNKMRNEHSDLKMRNTELQAENDKLRARVAELEEQLAQKTTSAASNESSNAEIQIPPSSVHVIMNIPKVSVPTHGPPQLHNPITYSVEKK